MSQHLLTRPKSPAQRPRTLSGYIGQDAIVQQLQVYIPAARQRGEPLDHVLLMGSPGLGKTTLAQIIAHELGAQLHVTSGPILDKPGDLAALLTQLAPGDVLFIDEIHRLSPTIEEILYPAMEDYQLDFIIGEGPGARSMRLDLSPFCLIGATTKPGALTAPLRDRFFIQFRLEQYSIENLRAILRQSCTQMGIAIDDPILDLIASRARGTPRIALRLLRRIRDFITVHDVAENLTSEKLLDYLAYLALDREGLDTIDRRLLQCLVERYSGGPVGLETLAISLGETKETLEDLIEPYLVQENFIERTARGRKITPKGMSHYQLHIKAT
ncbi:MAG: Holliday junction branch migration DNA helicase RuvB [Gammaproteobacteria bacterium]|nr:Holliday junction branch migration DNA helicase RuvB [Gammaproteobacteria bacterium]